jgi:hypothetical protein
MYIYIKVLIIGGKMQCYELTALKKELRFSCLDFTVDLSCENSRGKDFDDGFLVMLNVIFRIIV